MVNQICDCDREGSAPEMSRWSVGSRWINVGRLWAALFAVHKRSTCSPPFGEIHGLSTRSPANNPPGRIPRGSAAFDTKLPAAGVSKLLTHSGHAHARCIQALLLVKRGDVNAEGRVLRPAFVELRETRFSFHYTGFLGTLAAGLGSAGRRTEGLAVIDDAIERSERTAERWSMAELLRVKGELLLLQGEGNATAAEDYFLQALDWARRQELLSWELRGATSLARLWHRQRRTSQARKLLAPIYDRFTEGFGTADLIAAKAVLEALPEPTARRRRAGQ
jgi:hypothetical protein